MELRWHKILFWIGVVALIIGAIDPLEGSVIIVAGSLLVTLVMYLNKDPKRKLFFIATLMILFGVGFMFYFSTLGGWGGTSTLSWWWTSLLVPYPVGWIWLMILIFRPLIRDK